MSKLICPHCGAFTAFLPAQIRGKGLLVERSTEDRDMWEEVSIRAVTPHRPGQTTYAILICAGCEQRFVAKEEYDGWSAVYPTVHKTVSEDIPEPIKSEFEEAHLCFAIGAHRGCLLVCRTALIDMQRQQGVSGLNELKDKGIISPFLYRQTQEIRLWANMIAHELMLPEAVTKEDTEQLLVYLETLLDAIYIQPKRLSALIQKRDQLKKGTNPKPAPLA